MRLSKINLAYNLLIAFVIAVLLIPFVGVTTAFFVGGIIFLLGFVPQNAKGSFTMALQTEVWEQDIKEKLLTDNQFILKSTDRSEFVINKTVHEPQEGAAPNVEINRSTFPATVSERTDTENTWNLDQFTTDPIRINDIDEVQLSYSKRESVTRQHIRTLNEKIGDYVANRWAPGSSNIVRTSGALSAASLAPGATGTRKLLTVDDIVNLAAEMGDDNIPKENRFLLLPEKMYWDLYRTSSDLRMIHGAFAANPEMLKAGIVASFLGFTIMTRQRVNVYDNSAAPVLKAVGTASAADDNLSALAWHSDEVKRAIGDTVILSESGDNGKGSPTHYGVILSGIQYMGAKYSRSDKTGVYSLVQSA